MPYMQYQMPGQLNSGYDQAIQMMLLQQMMGGQQQQPQQPQQPGSGLGSLLGSGSSGGVGGWFGSGAGSGAGGVVDAGAGASSAIPEVSSLPMGNFELPSSFSLDAAYTPASVGAESAWSLGGIGSAGNAFLPLAGAAGAYDLFANKRGGGTRGALQGAASGAAMGSYFGPWGAVAGGALGLGAGLLGGGKSLKEKQRDRWDALGRPEGYADKGPPSWRNLDFERTRDEKYLTPADIWITQANYENVPDWDQWEKPKQEGFLSEMLKQGKVDEKKGGIYYDEDFAKQLAGQIREGNMPAGFTPTFSAPGAPAADVSIPKRSKTLSPGISLTGQRISY